MNGIKHKQPVKEGTIPIAAVLLPNDYQMVWKRRDKLFNDHLAKQKVKFMNQLKIFKENQEEIFNKGSSTIATRVVPHVSLAKSESQFIEKETPQNEAYYKLLFETSKSI